MSGLALTTGAVIAGRYRLERLLGRGGMGVVWGATHTVTERRVALKFLHGPAHLRSELKQRFLREARATTRVQHPNVVDVLDVFELEDETPVMVMEWLIGETLGERLVRTKALSLDATATLLVPAASAVDAAHARNIVHRDLKPDNIFIERSPEGDGRVKVLDFGIAKLVSAVTSDGGTETGAAIGTACYMAPEQAMGEKDVDQRADVWALGVILFECLAGARPIEGDSIGQVLMRVMSSGVRPLGQVVSGLPAEVTDLVDRMLERDRERRPRDLGQVLTVLERHTKARRSTPSPAPGSSDAGAPSVDVNAPTEQVSSRTGTAAGVAKPSDGVPAPPRSKRVFVLTVVGVALLGAVAANILGSARKDSAPPPRESARPTPSPRSAFKSRALTRLPADNPVWGIALTPDGSRYLYGDLFGIWLAPVQGGAPRKLVELDPESHRSFVLMPDGRTLVTPRSVGSTSVELDFVPVDGGAKRVLPVEAPGSDSGDIDSAVLDASPDGHELAVRFTSGLYAVDTKNGNARVITPIPAPQAVMSAAWSPDGTRVAFVVSGYFPDATTELAVVHSEGSGYRRLLADASLATPRSGAGVVWRDDRRIWVSRLNEVTEPPGSGLWEIDLGQPGGAVAPRRIFGWDLGFASSYAVSRGARRLITVLSRTQGDVFVGALGDAGRKLESVTRMTLNQGDDRPAEWLPDGRVLFMSDRYGTWDLLAQRPEGADAELLAGTEKWETWPTLLGGSILFWRFAPPVASRRPVAELVLIDEKRKERRVLERPMEADVRRDAAPPPLLLRVGCRRRDRPICVLGESSGTTYTLSRLDLESGQTGPPLYERSGKSASWEISPDGRSVAMVGLDIAGVVFVALEDGAAREIKLEPGVWQSVHWMPDGSALLLSGMRVRGHAYALARIDLKGKLDLVHASDSAWLTQALPSPAGDRLAFGAVAYERNVELLEGI